MTQTRPAGKTKNEKVGAVVSDKMAKTIVVEVTRRVQHPLYKRIINKRKKFYAHDENSEAKVGDVVRIVECRPLSKLKRWRLKEIVRRAVQVGEADLGALGIENTSPKRKTARKGEPQEAAGSQDRENKP